MFAFYGHKIIFFFTGNSTNNFPVDERLHENLICKNIQFLLVFPLNVLLSGGSNNINQSSFIYFIVDYFCSQTNGIKNPNWAGYYPAAV